MWIVSGKGGVGKTTVSALIAKILAVNSKVLLIEVDPRESVHRILGVPPSGGDIKQVTDNLFIQNLKPRSVIDELVKRRVKIGILVRRILRSPVYLSFADGSPGLKELAVFGYALDMVEGIEGGYKRFDCVVLDAPATGHGLSLIMAPFLVSSTIKKGPFGELAKKLAKFVYDRERCKIAVVATAEEMPITETIEFIEKLKQRIEREPEIVVINQLYPPFPTNHTPKKTEKHLYLWWRRHEINLSQIERLTKYWGKAIYKIPLVKSENNDLVDLIKTKIYV